MSGPRRPWTLLAVVVVAILLFACGNAPPSFDDSQCPFKLDPSQVLDQTVRCGILDVPEDRSQSRSNRIKVPVLVFKSPFPAATPMVNLAGGPGQSWADLGLSTITATDSAAFKRDQIFIEQRGTGLSTPNLGCPELDATSMDNMPANANPLQACLNRLIASGINLPAYNTRALAADVEDMRTVLGYPKLFLDGISYGTSWGLAIVRDFPQAVQGALLDSVLPPERPLFQGTASARDGALTALFAACQADAGCNGTFPDLNTKFTATVTALASKPVAWSVVPGGQLTADVYVSTVDQIQEVEPGFLPLFIEKVNDTIAAGQTTLTWNDPRAAQLLMVTMTATASLAVGQYFSIACSDNQLVTLADVNADVATTRPVLQSYLLGTVQGLVEVCQGWPYQQYPQSAFDRVQSSVPALLLSGGLDPTTPPAWAMDAVQGLSKGTLLEFPGSGHDVQDSVTGTAETCLSTAFDEFLSTGSVTDGACAAQAGPQWELM